jgi:SAM-dependent methyltransferase
LIEEFSPTENQNRLAYDSMARRSHVLATPVEPHELKNPLAIVDGRGWLGPSIRGWKVLCLAAAGGRHSILYSAAGATVTILDISDGMLELDRRACAEYKYDVRLIQGTMVSMPMFRNGEFDLVIHPVSTCYVPDIEPVFREVSRVLCPGGLYISQHKSAINLQSSLVTERGSYRIQTEVGNPANSVPTHQSSPLRESNTLEFAHSLESLLGGICRAGMVIEDLSEPDHTQRDSEIDSASHRARFIRPYLRVKARRQSSSDGPKIILF